MNDEGASELKACQAATVHFSPPARLAAADWSSVWHVSLAWADSPSVCVCTDDEFCIQIYNSNFTAFRWVVLFLNTKNADNYIFKTLHLLKFDTGLICLQRGRWTDRCRLTCKEVGNKCSVWMWRVCFTLMPLVSSSSKEPMSKASAAFTSPLGGIKGGEYCRQGTEERDRKDRERVFRGAEEKKRHRGG